VLISGAQIRAGRALVRMKQSELAEAARLDPATISDMEAKDSEVMRSSAASLLSVQLALEAAGVEFLDGDSPGVRLRPKGKG